ncbi:MAG: 6-phosphogluconolactonase [Candidatus Eremiobacteraeota bacterium]|nr:6-phosphogluconolactonase [Candidatus Eremiobacteraeota bacterium]
MNQNEHENVEIFESPGELAQALANHFINAAQTAITVRGAFFVALAGGTTPKAAYQLLAQEPYRDTVSWADVFIFFGDERCVPPDDDQSNYRMAKTAFLDGVNIPAHNIHRMRGEADPSTAAAEYATMMQQDLGEFPRFDLILLGMGPDGHTASLFPGSLQNHAGETLVEAPYVEKFKTYRLTITPRVINNAREVCIATEGAGKSPTLAAVLRGPKDPNKYPVQIVAPTDGQLTWLVDRAAASELET